MEEDEDEKKPAALPNVTGLKHNQENKKKEEEDAEETLPTLMQQMQLVSAYRGELRHKMYEDSTANCIFPYPWDQRPIRPPVNLYQDL